MPATITDGAMAMDGGSIFLSGVDADGSPLAVALDWSIESRRLGTCALRVNECIIPVDSTEEARWLAVLSEATCQPRAPHGEPEVAPTIALGADLAAFLSERDRGPAEGLAALARQLIAIVKSEAYRHQRPPPPPPAPLEARVSALLLEGKAFDALRLYRREKPELSLADARAALARLHKP